MKIKKAFKNLKSNIKIKKTLYALVAITLFLYIFSIPAFSGRAKWYIVSYLCMGMLLTVTSLYYFLYKKFFFQRRFLFIISFAIEALIGTSIFSHSFRGWLSIVLMILTMAIIFYSFLIINNKTLIFKLIVFSFLAFAAYFVLHYFSQIIKFQTLHEDKFFDNPNLIGTYFSLAFIISLYLVLFLRKKIELLYIMPCILFFALGFYTGSRQFLATTLVATIITVFLKMRRHLILFTIVFATIIVAFVFLIQIPALSFLREQINRTLYTIFGIGNSKVDTSTIQRVILSRYGFYLGSHNLVIGYGANGFSIFSEVGTYAHNNYSEMICDFGIIGIVLFYLSFLYPLFLAIKSKDKTTYLVIILVILYLIKGFFGVYYTYKDCYLSLAICLFLTREYSFGDFKIRNQDFQIVNI